MKYKIEEYTIIFEDEQTQEEKQETIAPDNLIIDAQEELDLSDILSDITGFLIGSLFYVEL